MYIHTQLATQMSTILVQCNMKCSTCDVCVFLPLICLQTGHQSLDATVVSVRSKLTKVGMLHLYMCEKCGLFLAKCLLTRSEQCRHLLLLMPIRLTIQYVITYYIECIWYPSSICAYIVLFMSVLYIVLFMSVFICTLCIGMM